MPSRAERWFRTHDGTEGCLADFTTTSANSKIAVIIAHPWGPLGGNLHNNVVAAVAMFFQQLKITTVRFNFSGWQIGRGHGQVDQVVSLAQQLYDGTLFATTATTDNQQSGVEHVLLVGYSYGSLITASAAADLCSSSAFPPNFLMGSVSIAPPFGVQHWLLCWSHQTHLQKAITLQANDDDENNNDPLRQQARETLPRLLVIGSCDNFTSEATFQKVLQSYNNNARQVATGAVMDHVDHFFAGHERDLVNVMAQWLLQTYDQTCQGDLQHLRNYSKTS